MQSGVGRVTFDRTKVLEQIRRQWLSNLAHDLSGPLFTARGYIRMILQAPDCHLSEDHKRYLALALENIERLAALARTMEDFPSAQEFEFQSFDVRNLLLEAIAEIVPVLEGRNVRVRQELSDGPMTTTGDRGRLAQALGAFFAAAARAVEPGGELGISAAEADRLVAIRLTASTAGSHAETGPDISLPSRLWQSHGGSIRTHRAEKQYSLTCELPVIRF